jgi:hypothetical protein
MVSASQFVKVGLADDDRPGGAKVSDARCIRTCDRIAEQARTRRRGPAANVDHVLDGYRYAMKRASAPTGPKLALSKTGTGKGFFPSNIYHCVAVGVTPVDALKTVFDQAYRREAMVIVGLYLRDRLGNKSSHRL